MSRERPLTDRTLPFVPDCDNLVKWLVTSHDVSAAFPS